MPSDRDNNNGTPFSMVTEGHEDRITRLESNVQEASEQVAAIGVEVKYLGKAMDDNRAAIMDKIESCFNPVADRLEFMQASIQGLDLNMGGTKARLEKLEGHEEVRTARRAMWRKIWMAVGIATVGAIIKELISLMVGR